ncbi:MAG: LysR family transcriptional regulator [Polyangiales bacterium]
MNWDDLRYLEAIARTGSVGHAARELRVSASTVYRRIAVLEGALGHPCIVRGLEPSVLTEAGRALARVGDKTRLSLAEAAGGVRARETEISGQVSLTTVEAMAPFLVEPIAALTQKHPSLRVLLHLADTGPSLRRREVDVAIGIMPRPPSGCFGRRILRIPYGVFGTKEALQSKPGPRWITRGERLRHSPEALWETKHATEVAAASSLLIGVVELVAGGVGIGLLPRMIAARHPALVELSKYRESVAPLERVAWVRVHPEQRKTPRVMVLVEALTQGFATIGRDLGLSLKRR